MTSSGIRLAATHGHVYQATMVELLDKVHHIPNICTCSLCVDTHTQDANLVNYVTPCFCVELPAMKYTTNRVCRQIHVLLRQLQAILVFTHCVN